jgi:hypothetical protein
MAGKAKSISASDLSKITKAAVKVAAAGVPGKFTNGGGPTTGYILKKALPPEAQLALASSIAKQVTANAKAEGIPGLQPKPVVITRPGGTTIGYLAHELNITVK